MSADLQDTRILRYDGLVHVALPSGAHYPLFKLASGCNYRIDVLCKEIDVSPRHFRRIFSREIGVCPKQWLKSERMVYARNLLRSGMPIKEASERLGFRTQKDFSRDFRKCYNISPSEFRNQETGRVMERLQHGV